VHLNKALSTIFLLFAIQNSSKTARLTVHTVSFFFSNTSDVFVEKEKKRQMEQKAAH
jgi:hypothetical protein